jgi:hypothetical protein
MQNMFQCVCCSGMGKKMIWNWLNGDEVIYTQSIPPQLFSEALSPQIAPVSCLLLPTLSTLVYCCLGWVSQHLQAFCMLLAAHCHHIVVIPLLSSNCCCPFAIYELPLSLSSTLLLLAATAASSPLPLPLPSPLPLLSPPSLSLPSLLMSLCQRCFVIFVAGVLLGSQSEELDQTTIQKHHTWHADGTPTLGLAARGPAESTQGHYVPDVFLLEISWCLSNGGWS